ncbi:MAG TPA: hypothetical protein EYM32_12895 [Dehalococcoidia bacterium]|nr:hypothetical protein [Dehalococcoidia bacterium]
MKRAGIWLCFLLAGMVMMLTGCFQTVPRTPVDPVTVAPTVRNLVSTRIPTATPVVAPTFTPVPEVTSVPEPPTPTPQTATATPKPTLIPTKMPVPPPTVLPTVTPPPTQDPVPELLLEVHEPVDGIEVSGDTVVVRGITQSGAAVTINDVPAILEGNGKQGIAFRGYVPLALGENEIMVVASDNLGNQSTRVLTVKSIAPPPLPFLLVITEPRDLSIVSTGIIRLSGRTGPEAVISVNGVSSPIDLVGNFSTLVVLEPGPNIIDVVSTNSDGQVMSAVAAVIYRP